MKEVYIGIDPSFKRTGLAFMSENKIFVDEVKRESNDDKSFEQIFRDCNEVSNEVLGKIVRLYDPRETEFYIFSECPPPQGSFSPGLYGLDITLFGSLKGLRSQVNVLYPNFIGHVHGKRKYNKSESVEVAKFILSKYNHVILSKRLSHDESEAVIILARNLASVNLLDKDILSRYPGLKDKKEKVLFSF